jgi:anaerobic ribonucleoside-triphosphate reductase activating protein
VTQIAISRLHFPVTTLGPGKRLGIWLQGCSIRCLGCISADTWPLARGVTTVTAVVEALEAWLPLADGVTVSGGEPFDQPHALRRLLRDLRTRTNVDILVYSGYPVEALDTWLRETPGLIDALISDPYDAGASHTLVLRGSDNQRLHLLTDLGRARFAEFDRPRVASDRKFDLMFDTDGSVWLAGIPAQDDFRRFGEALHAAGHRVVLSQSILVESDT